MNKKIWVNVVTVTMVVAFLGFFSPAGAQLQAGNIKLGPLAIHPFVGLTETYNDNVFKNYANLPKESDFITTLTPGIQLFLPVQRHSFQIDYQADMNWYSSNSKANYTNQRVGGAAKLDFPGGLLLNISDYYSDAKIARKAKEQAGISSNSSTDPYRELPYTQNEFAAMARYRFVDRWAIEGRYNNFDYAYKNSYDEGGNLKRDTFGGSLYYRFTPKMDALVDYNYATTKYKTATQSNNKDQSVLAGLSFDPTAKLKGYLKFGWAVKDYDNSQAGRGNSFSTFASAIDLTYAMSQNDQLVLRGLRTIQEDVDTNAPFTNTDVSLGYRHILPWNQKVSLNAGVGYGTQKFEQSMRDIDGVVKTRDDKKLYGTVGIGYAIQRWLNLALNYSYTNNDSNALNYKYTENKVWFNAIAGF